MGFVVLAAFFGPFITLALIDRGVRLSEIDGSHGFHGSLRCLLGHLDTVAKRRKYPVETLSRMGVIGIHLRKGIVFGIQMWRIQNLLLGNKVKFTT